MSVSLPEHYHSSLSVRDTEEAIKYIRDSFQEAFAKKLHLSRISAPLFLPRNTGLNDDLNGVERPVAFDAKDLSGSTMEIVQSLAKWKRHALQKYDFPVHDGLYTNMNAIRRDESLDAIHSIYVDQWDWEKVITHEERTISFLEDTVQQIVEVIASMDHKVREQYSLDSEPLCDTVTFITSEALEALYPDLSAKQRENIFTKEHKCVFIEKIGWPLPLSNEPHDGRAPDYDDWSLNGDLLFWLPSLEIALEVSSMGIRVDETSMVHQCIAAHCENRLVMEYHKQVLNRELPYTIGGGIGQSRLCMLLLNKAHIGEVQASVWPDAMIEDCHKRGIELL